MLKNQKNNPKKFKKDAEKAKSSSENSDDDETIPSDKIEYNMPKPGPHAKVKFLKSHAFTFFDRLKKLAHRPANGENGNL
jgi:hypothetical protein